MSFSADDTRYMARALELAKRGLYDFVTQCDKSTNTDTRIQNNQMWMYVALKPTLTAEFLYIPIRVLSVGDSMP